MSELDLNDLPDYRAWRANYDPKPGIDAYLSEHLSVTAAAFLAQLLAPEFKLVRDCVLVSQRFDQANFDEWWERQKGDVPAIESVVNHLHLWDIFEPSGDAENRALDWLASKVARAWELHAAAQFPDREFTAQVTDEYGPTITITSSPRSG